MSQRIYYPYCFKSFVYGYKKKKIQPGIYEVNIPNDLGDSCIVVDKNKLTVNSKRFLKELQN